MFCRPRANSKPSSISNTPLITVSAVVEENTASAEEMSATSSGVSQEVESIASVSEENSAAIEEVSASTEEMTAQVQEVTASATELADMAKALQQVVDQFKLEAGTIRQTSKAVVQKTNGNGKHGSNGGQAYFHQDMNQNRILSKN